MSDHGDKLDNKALIADASEASEPPCQQRRRLLVILGVGIASASAAPTLFSVGAAEARDRYDRRGRSGKRGRYSRGSYSRVSYDYRGRERSRLRDYQDDPVLILEDVTLGPPRR